MKYFVVESVMKDPLPVSREAFETVYAPQHVAHMNEGVDAGLILMAGPNELGGGFLLFRAETREEAERFLEADTFRVNGLNEFRITEFFPKDRAELVKNW